MEVSAFEIFAHDLADDLAPGAVLLVVALVVNALELLVIVFHQGIERAGARVAGLISSGRWGLHAPDNRRGWRLSEKIERSARALRSTLSIPTPGFGSVETKAPPTSAPDEQVESTPAPAVVTEATPMPNAANPLRCIGGNSAILGLMFLFLLPALKKVQNS